MKKIDCLNMACPLPVVTVKRALDEEKGDGVQVLLDAGAPRENVTRFAVNRGCKVAEEEVESNVWLLTITGDGQLSKEIEMSDRRPGPTVMLIASDRLGFGPEDLGKLLMKNFIISLVDQDELPDRMFFINSGVLLTTEGTDLLDTFEKLGNRGVEVFSCGICLDYFYRKEKLKVGSTTNMFTLAESLLKAGLVIRP